MMKRASTHYTSGAKLPTAISKDNLALRHSALAKGRRGEKRCQ
jgi:hypothetical protein